jgi:hypothetical protein
MEIKMTKQIERSSGFTHQIYPNAEESPHVTKARKKLSKMLESVNSKFTPDAIQKAKEAILANLANNFNERVRLDGKLKGKKVKREQNAPKNGVTNKSRQVLDFAEQKSSNGSLEGRVK